MKRELVLMAVALAGCAPEEQTDVCATVNPGDLVITEVLTDPTSTDTGNEFVEIFNTTPNAIELKGFTLFVQELDGTGTKNHNIRAGSVASMGYFAMGDVRSGPNPAWIGYSYNNALGSLGNTNGVIGLRCGQKVLTQFTWTEASEAGRSRQLNGALAPTADAAAVATNFCETPEGQTYDTANAGTPGAANVSCTANPSMGTCTDSAGTARPIVSPSAGQLIINEVMARPAAVTASNGEWVELYAMADVDLNGLKLKTASSATTFTSDTCVRVTAGTYVLVARSGDAAANGNLPPPAFVYGSLQITDSSEQQLTLLAGDTVVDEARIFSSTSGKAWQLDPSKRDAAQNDGPEAFCLAPSQWTAGAGDYGSPGAVNPTCPAAVVTGQCFDEGTGAMRAARTPAPGTLVMTEWMSAPSTPQADKEWLEALATADLDLNGVTLRIGSSSATINSPSCVPVTANSYVLWGKNADPERNGNLPPLAGSFTTSLTGTSVISLLLADAGVLDTVTLSGEFSGASTQLAPGNETVDLNDVASNRCKAPNRWNPDGGGDFGSPGAANPACAAPVDPNQCLDSSTGSMRAIVRPADGSLVITEWLSNPAAVDDARGEFFEVLSTGAADLNGLTLVVGTTRTSLGGSTCQRVSAGSYLVFGRNADPTLNGNLPALTSTFAGSLTSTSTISIVGVDGGVYDSVAPMGEFNGASTQVAPTALTVAGNDDGANRCRSPNTWSLDGGGDFGSPGVANPACAVPTDPNQCLDSSTGSMRAIRVPPTGSLVITEWMANPEAVDDGVGEYLEVRSGANADLNGVGIQVGSVKTTLGGATCLPVTSGAFLLFAHEPNSTANGNLPPLTATFPSVLSNSGATLSVVMPDGGLYDSVTYTSATAGASTQLAPAFSAPADNDLAGNLCTAPTTARYGAVGADGGVTGDRGTPGLVNTCL